MTNYLRSVNVKLQSNEGRPREVIVDRNVQHLVHYPVHYCGVGKWAQNDHAKRKSCSSDCRREHNDRADAANSRGFWALGPVNNYGDLLSGAADGGLRPRQSRTELFGLAALRRQAPRDEPLSGLPRKRLADRQSRHAVAVQSLDEPLQGGSHRKGHPVVEPPGLSIADRIAPAAKRAAVALRRLSNRHLRSPPEQSACAKSSVSFLPRAS